MLSTGEYAIESIYTRTLLDTEPFFQTSPKSYRTLKGSFFSLLGPWSAQGNYYHWLHDALLRLYRVQPKLPSTVKYLVPANLRPFQIDSLCMLGIEPNQYISLELDEAVQVEQLYFAPPTSHSGSDRAAADEWLREQFWHACGISHPVAKEYIYITRRRASRHIVNEKDVVNLLARHGFHTVTCEQLTLKEQVELFSQARVIVASHGAGLTNAWFAPSGAQVLDILQPSHKDWAYVFWSLCNALDHDYWYLWGESISTKETTPTENIVVSIERLRKTLEQMGISEKESRVTG
ncbi:MAG: hypothetical protein BroJett039_06180 [Chloroflexota bacterium]|nr:MAG: hypothetical protein BroJett039_06180 [Chloroflexota bacterium]